MASKNRLIIFTRYPTAGEAKTRLIAELGPKGAADLSRDMTEVLLKKLEDFDIELRFDGGSEKKMKEWLGSDLPIRNQGAGDLGERMMKTFNETFFEGAEKVIIIGSDCPSITPELIRDAYDALDSNDLVLGPAEDGGYYLIGLKETIPLLFQGVAWGTDIVFKRTMEIAEPLGIKIHLLKKLHDIDRAEDLQFLPGVLKRREKISIIIPTLNEEPAVGKTLASLKGCDDVEIILVDGGSMDRTVDVARKHGATVILTECGRAFQMNAGARLATGTILLFLHADTLLPEQFDEEIRNALKGNIAAGAFKFAIDDRGLRPRAIEKLANFRSQRMQKPYGDQAIFLRRHLFEKVGGFPEMPIMEDYQFILNLRKYGKITTLPSKALTSSRRWRRRGWVKTTLINQLVIIGYHLGVSPEKLAKIYRRQYD